MPDKSQMDGIISKRAIFFMEDFFKESNISYINMHDYFNGKNSNKFYFPIDAHLNAGGHEEVAKAVYEKLQSSKYL